MRETSPFDEMLLRCPNCGGVELDFIPTAGRDNEYRCAFCGYVLRLLPLPAWRRP